ncbi:hypothetical protein Tco_1520974 [Tanacetum coccineum]
MFSNYDCEVRYHPGKANVVADALSRKERVKPRRVRAMSMTIQSRIKEKLLAAQNEATKEENAPTEMLCGLDQQMEKKEDGGADKMYYDLRDMYLWIGIKKDIATYVNKSPVLWAEVGENQLIGPELVQETTDKVVLIDAFG